MASKWLVFCYFYLLLWVFVNYYDIKSADSVMVCLSFPVQLFGTSVKNDD